MPKRYPEDAEDDRRRRGYTERPGWPRERFDFDQGSTDTPALPRTRLAR